MRECNVNMMRLIYPDMDWNASNWRRGVRHVSSDRFLQIECLEREKYALQQLEKFVDSPVDGVDVGE
jgi:hypothetical protein